MNDLGSRIWSRLEDHPWLTMILAVLAQSWFCLGNRALWFSDEVRYADAYHNLAVNGNWMVLALNGQVYPDKPPVYFWFLWLLDKLTPFDAPSIFFLGAALSGLFFLFAAYALSRTLKFDRSTSLGSTLVLLATFFLVALFHYSRMDLMFAGLIILSHACLYRAVNENSTQRWALWGCVLAGVATLVKGPLGFLFPLLTLVLYLFWKGQLKKLFTRAFGMGLLAMLAILAAWVAGVILVQGPGFLFHAVLGKQILQRATHTFHHMEPFYYYLIAFPLAWLPWSLILIAIPVKRYLSLGQWGELWAEHRQAGPRTFLWIMFAVTFIFLSSLSGKVLIYILPMFPPLAILTADALRVMEPHRLKRLWTAIAGLWLLFGASLVLAGDLIPVPVPIHGMGISACLLLAGGAALYTLRSKGYKTPLLTVALALTIWLYPVGLMVAPSLDNAMSPKRQALVLKKYIEQGYTPYAGNIYSGIYTYYAGHVINENDHLDKLVQELRQDPKAVLVIRETHWNDIKAQLPEFRIVNRQSIAGLRYLLLIKG